MPVQVRPAVLEGRATGTGESPSVFSKLGVMKTVDEIVVDRADGTTTVFEVIDVRNHPRAHLPQVDVYGATSGHELRALA